MVHKQINNRWPKKIIWTKQLQQNWKEENARISALIGSSSSSHLSSRIMKIDHEKFL